MIGLIVLFSVAVSFSLLWFCEIGFYVFAKIGLPQLFGLPIADVAMLAATAFVPVMALWLVVGLIYNVMILKKQSGTINLLLTQTRRSADHAEAMVRTLMETQVQTRSATILRNVDLFVNELNDLLSDILAHLGILQTSQIEMIWQRVGEGNRWEFCKTLLLCAENSPHFKEDLAHQIIRDEVLAGYVRTYCYRFEQMFTMVERHDVEHYLTKLFEEGAVGRVYMRFVESCRVADEAGAPQTAPRAAAPIEDIPDPDEDDTDDFIDTLSATDYPEIYSQMDEPESELEPELPDPDEYAADEPDFKPSPETPAGGETYYPDPEPMPDEAPEETATPFGFLRPTR